MTVDTPLKYLLSEEEITIFTHILLKDKSSQHTAFIIVLLKELDYDFQKFMRVIGVGFSTRSVIQKSTINKVISTIKQAVIIKDIEFKDVLDKVTITELANSPRYVDMGITREFIYSTIYKHGLEVLN